MAFRLADDVHWCVCDAQVVFLDIRRNRYFKLPRSVDDHRVANVRQRQQPSREMWHYLDRHGLATQARGGPQLLEPASYPSPATDCGNACARVGAIGLASAFAGLARARISLRICGLGMLIARVARTKSLMPEAEMQATPRAIGIAANYAALGRYRSTANLCLPLSFGMAADLMRAGYAPHLAIGVRAAPFSAHCWVQLGDVVMSDDVDEVCKYTPILMV